MSIGLYSPDDFLNLVKSFHGSVAPGIVSGWYMVSALQKQLPKDRLYDTLCEMLACLPDAVRLLTPCTAVNSQLKVVDLGRTLFGKENDYGLRAYLQKARNVNTANKYY